MLSSFEINSDYFQTYSLEWTTTTPPVLHTFEELPKVITVRQYGL